MTDTRPDGDTRYEIRVRGRLDTRWASWFDGCTLEGQLDGTTLIVADAIDQAALHGLLRTIRDAGLPLISVSPAEPD